MNLKIEIFSDCSILVSGAKPENLDVWLSRVEPDAIRQWGENSILLKFDPFKWTDLESKMEGLVQLQAELDKPEALKPEAAQEAEEIIIPVCYHESLGLDLSEISQSLGLGISQIIELHKKGAYRVSYMGFLPGFGYLSGLDPTLKIPRKESARLKIPMGSVAIAEGQCGIYPVETPGGWNIIGRTPIRMFDPKAKLKERAFVFSPGARVRFVEITLDHYQEVSKWNS